jgi:thiol-disulfide isomerase/thioredoxin
MKFNHVLGLASCIGLSMGYLNVRADTTGQQLAEGAGRPLIGTPAPRLVLKTIDGKTIDLGQRYGRQAVYLKFWATWCVPCREQMPHFEHVYETAGPDLAVIAINSGFNDSLEDVRVYRQKLGITMPIVLDDGQAGAAFNLRVTPQHIVIGRDGRIQYVGHLADARLDAALVAARTAPLASAADAAQGSNSPATIVRLKVGDHVSKESPLTIDGAAFPFHDPGITTGHTVLVFLSPWCESYLATTRPEVSSNCRRMREQVTALASERDARWLGIASGLWATPDDLRQYRSKYHVDLPLALDESGALFRSFNVSQVPTALIVDAGGRIVRRVEGAELASPDMMRTAIRSP